MTRLIDGLFSRNNLFSFSILKFSDTTDSDSEDYYKTRKNIGYCCWNGQNTELDKIKNYDHLVVTGGGRTSTLNCVGTVLVH